MRTGLVLAAVAAVALSTADAAHHHHHKDYDATPAPSPAVYTSAPPAYTDKPKHTPKHTLKSTTKAPCTKTPKPSTYDLYDGDSLEVDGSDDIDIYEEDVEGDESISAEGDSVEVSYDGDDSVEYEASLENDEEYEASIDLDDGEFDVSFDDSEDYSQDTVLSDDQELDQIITLPKDAESVRLRVRNGVVDLDVIRRSHGKDEKIEKSEKAAETEEGEEHETVVLAAQKWFQDNATKPVFIGSIAGAVAAMVGVAGVVIAKRRNAEFERSVLALETAEADNTASVEMDAPAESTEEESATEEVKDNGVVEGSV
ncbi:TPA: hypothetical protein N0F65_004286 [Lagenidium giganteum]|uniref:Uncharacterized protein n=1 Tax=Lagenidium giganteum TaxID=4803 RepID=A0AAV2ZB18_9STRA|nr:TPA: hypothetical protein N0F65_004286 [Lagenidium giganteum]